MSHLPIPKVNEGSSRAICYAHAPATVVLFNEPDCPLCRLLGSKPGYTRTHAYYTSGINSKVMEDDGVTGVLREVRESE